MSSKIEVLAKESVSSLGPSKSIGEYSAANDDFVNWCSSNNVTIYRENIPTLCLRNFQHCRDMANMYMLQNQSYASPRGSVYEGLQLLTSLFHFVPYVTSIKLSTIKLPRNILFLLTKFTNNISQLNSWNLELSKNTRNL